MLNAYAALAYSYLCTVTLVTDVSLLEPPPPPATLVLSDLQQRGWGVHRGMGGHPHRGVWHRVVLRREVDV